MRIINLRTDADKRSAMLFCRSICFNLVPDNSCVIICPIIELCSGRTDVLFARCFRNEVNQEAFSLLCSGADALNVRRQRFLKENFLSLIKQQNGRHNFMQR